MPLMLPPSDCDPRIAAAVKALNQLKPGESDVERIFLLQKIDYLLEMSPPRQSVLEWQYAKPPGSDSTDKFTNWETQLQAYGIHRDASDFVKNIEFASAVNRYAEGSIQPSEPLRSMHETMQSLDHLFQTRTAYEAMPAYVQESRLLMTLFNQSEKMQSKFTTHRHVLALTYAKLESILGVLSSQFDEYETRGVSTKGNNQIFLLKVDGELHPLVIRVENRNDLSDERRLRRQVVSEQFLEDYATLRVRFMDKRLKRSVIRSVVMCQFADQGDLFHYAKSLDNTQETQMVANIKTCFLQITALLSALQASDYYHPDIKLTNFLLHEGQVILGDRKALIGVSRPSVHALLTTERYAPNEFLRKLSNPLTDTQYVDMPSYMSYQVGMALKEFLFLSQATRLKQQIPDRDQRDHLFLSHESIAKVFDESSPAMLNLSLLIQELTRQDPGTRLSLDHFAILLEKIEHKPEHFKAELDRLSPLEAAHPLHELLASTLSQEAFIEKALMTVKDMPQIMMQDERVKPLLMQVLTRANVMHEVMQYSAELEASLLEADVVKASRFRRFAHGLGVLHVPRQNGVCDLGNTLPSLNEHTARCLILFNQLQKIMPSNLGPQGDALNHVLLLQPLLTKTSHVSMPDSHQVMSSLLAPSNETEESILRHLPPVEEVDVPVAGTKSVMSSIMRGDRKKSPAKTEAPEPPRPINILKNRF